VILEGVFLALGRRVGGFEAYDLVALLEIDEGRILPLERLASCRIQHPVGPMPALVLRIRQVLLNPRALIARAVHFHHSICMLVLCGIIKFLRILAEPVFLSRDAAGLLLVDLPRTETKFLLQFCRALIDLIHARTDGGFSRFEASSLHLEGDLNQCKIRGGSHTLR